MQIYSVNCISTVVSVELLLLIFRARAATTVCGPYWISYFYPSNESQIWRPKVLKSQYNLNTLMMKSCALGEFLFRRETVSCCNFRVHCPICSKRVYEYMFLFYLEHLNLSKVWLCLIKNEASSFDVV